MGASPEGFQPPGKVAVVHEWLASYVGSERVVEQFLAMMPTADLYAVVDLLQGEDRAFLGGRTVHTSFIQRLPLRKRFRAWLPLMPLAVEQFDLRDYDMVVSSNHAVAKGVLTGPDQVHLCYCYSPMRYAWDLQAQYLRESAWRGFAFDAGASALVGCRVGNTSRLHRYPVALYCPPHCQVLGARERCCLPASGGRSFWLTGYQIEALRHRFADGAVQADPAHREGFCPDARARVGGDRRWARLEALCRRS